MKWLARRWMTRIAWAAVLNVVLATFTPCRGQFTPAKPAADTVKKPTPIQRDFFSDTFDIHRIKYALYEVNGDGVMRVDLSKPIGNPWRYRYEERDPPYWGNGNLLSPILSVMYSDRKHTLLPQLRPIPWESYFYPVRPVLFAKSSVPVVIATAHQGTYPANGATSIQQYSFLDLELARTFRDSTHLYLQYRRGIDAGLIPNNRSALTSFKPTILWTTTRLRLAAVYHYDELIHQESGGISDTTLWTNASFQNRQLLLTRLSDAQLLWKRYHLGLLGYVQWRSGQPLFIHFDIGYTKKTHKFHDFQVDTNFYPPQLVEDPRGILRYWKASELNGTTYVRYIGRNWSAKFGMIGQYIDLRQNDSQRMLSGTGPFVDFQWSINSSSTLSTRWRWMRYRSNRYSFDLQYAKRWQKEHRFHAFLHRGRYAWSPTDAWVMNFSTVLRDTLDATQQIQYAGLHYAYRDLTNLTVRYLMLSQVPWYISEDFTLSHTDKTIHAIECKWTLQGTFFNRWTIYNAFTYTWSVNYTALVVPAWANYLEFSYRMPLRRKEAYQHFGVATQMIAGRTFPLHYHPFYQAYAAKDYRQYKIFGRWDLLYYIYVPQFTLFFRLDNVGDLLLQPKYVELVRGMPYPDWHLRIGIQWVFLQ